MQIKEFEYKNKDHVLNQSIHHTDLLRIAASRTQGMLVAPRTNIPSLLLPTPAKERCQQTIKLSQDTDEFVAYILKKKLYTTVYVFPGQF